MKNTLPNDCAHKAYFLKVFGASPEDVLEEHRLDFAAGRVSRLQEAYNKAHDIRKFEIELFWKRNTYFWLMEAVLLTGFFYSVASSQYSSKASVLIIPIGTVFTWLWLKATQGSKFWQENWEKHIDMLETEVCGNLHKTYWNNTNEEHFSVSKISEISCRLFLFAWILSHAIPFYTISSPYYIFGFITIFISSFLFTMIKFFYPVLSNPLKYNKKRVFSRGAPNKKLV